jgi:hypothetical protein
MRRQGIVIPGMTGHAQGGPARTFALSIHADYACRDSGACCTSGWPIAVEPEVAGVLRRALDAGRLQTPVPALLTGEGRPVLGVDACGRCAFHEGDRCAVHRVLGPEALPSSCRHFPRVCRMTPSGVAVTLSHYCPTAAGLLFRDDRELAVTADPPAFPPAVWYEGLDARRSPPPFLRPGVWMDWESHEAWERHAVATFAREDLSPEEAVTVLARQAESLRAWTPGATDLRDSVAAVASARAPRPAANPWPGTGLLQIATQVAACVPTGITAAPLPADVEAADAAWVGGRWPAFAAVVRRYLAARAFGSWVALQGEGLRTSVRSWAAALAVLRLEAGRACAQAGRELDARLLTEAVRQSDLLLVHLASPEALARAWSVVEGDPAFQAKLLR